jgi:hypothetical protein
MTDDTLKLLEAHLRKRGISLTAISTAAAVLCGIIDHWNRLHWDDRNRLTAEVKQLRDRIAKIEYASHPE